MSMIKEIEFADNDKQRSSQAKEQLIRCLIWQRNQNFPE